MKHVLVLCAAGWLTLCGVCVLTPSCSSTHRVQVDPVEVKPIHMTIDINVKVDRKLDEFFDFEDELGGADADDSNVKGDT